MRIASSERNVTLKKMPERKAVISSQPLALKPVPITNDEPYTASVPDLQQEGGSIAGRDGEGFGGLQPEPGAGSAGWFFSG